MSRRDPAGSTPAAAAAAAAAANEAWLSVSEDLLWGINHAMSNRLAALSSLAKILEHSDTGLDPLVSVLSQEVAQLEQTLQLLRLMPRSADEMPEAVRLADVLPDVLALHRLQSEVRDLDYRVSQPPDLLPVWVEPSVLTRSLLLLLAVASRSAADVPGAAVTIGCTGDEEWVSVEIAAPAAGAGVPGGLHARAAAALLAGPGGELIGAETAGAEAGVRFTIRLPTLTAARRRERLSRD